MSQRQNRTKQASLAPLDVIRTETVLSKLPFHNLSKPKKGRVPINIKETSEEGKVKLLWKVSYSDYGPAGQLAYKLDTLVINRRIDEERRKQGTVPKVLRIGSLREIGLLLGLGGDTGKVKKALLQGAFTGVTAKITYKGSDGVERTMEIGDTRYGVVFTGETLPDGRKADAVYIVLHDFYWEILNHAPIRPLDYDYLKELPPAAQRFYELVSYKIYAALSHRLPCAKLVYSEFCTYAPQKRYEDWEHVRKQMRKVHLPHLQSGYIAQVEFERTTDKAGKPDWNMFYTPGPKAKAQYRVFTGKFQPALEVLPAASPPAPGGGAQTQPPALPAAPPAPPSRSRSRLVEDADASAEPSAAPTPALSEEEEELVGRLIKHSVTATVARQMVKKFPREQIERQLTYLPHREGKDRAAILVSAIKGDWAPPEDYLRAERERQAEAQRRVQKEQEEQERKRVDAEWERMRQIFRSLPAEVQAQVRAEALAQMPRLVQEQMAQGKEPSQGLLETNINKILRERFLKESPLPLGDTPSQEKPDAAHTDRRPAHG